MKRILEPLVDQIELIGTPEQLKIWIKALRYGKYKQCKGDMARKEVPNSACCLHVAAVEVDGAEYNKGFGAGLPTPTDRFAYRASTTTLASSPDESLELLPDVLNDDLGLTFSQIADLLEGKTVESYTPRKLLP